MNRDNNDIDKIIARVLFREASTEDILILSEWLNESDKNRKEFQILKEFLETEVKIDKSMSANISFERFLRKQQLKSQPIQSNLKRRQKLMIFSLVASITLFIAISSLFFILNNDQPLNTYTYVSENEMCDILLPDSSKVLLNHNSRLTYSDSFNKSERRIYLEGEAYFDITKNKEKKFIVDLGTSTIEVIGTKFNVFARTEDENIVATLIEGSILFGDSIQQIILSPNQQLVFNKTTRSIKNSDVDPDIYTAWQDKLYRYYSISLRDLAIELERIYGINVVVKDKFKDVKVSGSFLYGESIDQIMAIMQKTIKYKWYRENNTIIIE